MDLRGKVPGADRWWLDDTPGVIKAAILGGKLRLWHQRRDRIGANTCVSAT